jgi:hypothetical protein
VVTQSSRSDRVNILKMVGWQSEQLAAQSRIIFMHYLIHIRISHIVPLILKESTEK